MESLVTYELNEPYTMSFMLAYRGPINGHYSASIECERSRL